MKTLEIQYQTPEGEVALRFNNRLHSWESGKLAYCKTHNETAFASDSLSVDYITYKVVCDTSLKNYFAYDGAHLLYDDGVLRGKYYAAEVTRESKRFYKVKAYSDMQFLENRTHAGGIYQGQTAAEILAEIMGTIPYTLEAEVGENLMYGWLPYATARENPSQVLFALGAGVYRDENYAIYIRYALSDSLGSLPASQLYSGGKETAGQPATLAVVYSHRYVQGGESVTLLDESSTDTQTILFDEPMYNLAISGGTILESGVNYARIQGNGAVVLTGNKYVHTTEILQVGDDAAETDSTSTVKDATMVSALNAQNVAQRVYQAGLYADTLDYGVYDHAIAPGDCYQVQTMDDGLQACVVSSVDTTYSAKNRADCCFTIGEPLGGVDSDTSGNTYNHYQIFSSKGTFTVPTGTTKLRVILIGGGNGGQDGKDGGDVAEVDQSATYSSRTSSGSSTTLTHVNTTAAADPGAGGAGGAGGEGGKLLQLDLSVSPGDSFAVTIGSGGAASGGTGGNTTFGSYSSKDGASSSEGYTDMFTLQTFGSAGSDGQDGGDGGAPGSAGGANGDSAGGKGQAAESYSTASQTYTYTNYSLTTSATGEVGGAGGGGAGGNAGSKAGGAGTDCSEHSTTYKSTAYSVYGYYYNKNYMAPVVPGYVPGSGGDGASADAATVYGCGGTGGGGGGGAGGRGENSGTGTTVFTKISGSATMYAYAVSAGGGATGGSGGKGGAGASGCVIVYY